MKKYQEYFKDKKVTMLGLGLLGRGLNDAKFIAESGADLIVTDLKKAEELKPTHDKLKKYKNIKYVLGEHRLEDFKNRDFILKAAGVPLDSIYINEAIKNQIPVEMDESLFTKICHELYGKEVTIIGVTGTRGKTTTTYLIYEMLKDYFGEKKVHLGGNIKGLATLPLIKKVKLGDMVVMELSSWQLQGFGDSGISPDIAVFTNLLPDHLNYYLKVSRDEKEAEQKYFEDKAKIFTNQTANDWLILEKESQQAIKERYQGEIKAKIILPDHKQLVGWKPKLKGEHNANHIAQALEVGKILNVPVKNMRRSLENFAGVEGRLEFIKTYKGIDIYNDTTSTTPDALAVALESIHEDLKDKGRLILIAGGSNKNLDMSQAVKDIKKYADYIVLLSGTGTDLIKTEILTSKKGQSLEAGDLKTAVKQTLVWAKKGDVILFSPGFASFGMFKNEFDRGEQFVRIIKNLK
jgi:UDP-N-acetylmuramoylalanine--D-glutamate ligase